MPEQILSEFAGAESTLTYKIDGNDFLFYGVYVSASGGMQDAPSLKEPQTVNWPGSHGTVVDLAAPRYNNREIELDCFIKAAGKLDFFNKVRAFLQAFQKPGLRRLELWIATKPLVYLVYLSEGVNIEKQWHEDEMFGTFTLKLIDPHPVKRLLKVVGSAVSIQFTSANPISIFWGDGSVKHDLLDDVVLTYNYASAGTYYPVVCGVIEEIEDFVHNAEVLWSKY